MKLSKEEKMKSRFNFFFKGFMPISSKLRTLLNLGIFFINILSGCSFHFELTSPRTALENQMLGDYREIEEILPEYSAARQFVYRGSGEQLGEDKGIGANVVRAEKWKTLDPEKTRALRKGDVRYLKDREFVGESKTALLTILPKGVGKIDIAGKGERLWALSVTRAENADRLRLIGSKNGPNKNALVDELAETSFKNTVFKEVKEGDWIESDGWRKHQVLSSLEQKEDLRE